LTLLFKDFCETWVNAQLETLNQKDAQRGKGELIDCEFACGLRRDKAGNEATGRKRYAEHHLPQVVRKRCAYGKAGGQE
jgi:hypothetical protein